MKLPSIRSADAIRTLSCSMVAAFILVPLRSGAVDAAADSYLWSLAQAESRSHRFSTLFTAQDVRDRLASEDGIDRAVDWCRRTAVTKAYVESFRDGYLAERPALVRARDHLRAAGIEVSGCVTPTRVGRPSTGWNLISCYTDAATQDRVRALFEFTAGLFDEVMIDDFWFTDCACEACEAARRAQSVKVGGRVYPVGGDTWDAYRCELMVQLSRQNVLAASRRVNPRCRLIIKYPQWYDRFHVRGYEVVRETRDFDRIWVGTETRDYVDRQWGGTPQYEAFFIMRWLGGLGGSKCGGGWYDWLGTTEQTYLEQARQTILGGARESMLFCYGGLQGSTGPQNVDALRRELPELFRLARQVSGRRLVGVAAYKPPGSDPGSESRVFDFVGMLGLPLVPCHAFPSRAPAAFFSVHALKEPDFPSQLGRFVAKGRPVIVTDGLAAQCQGQPWLGAPNVRVLPLGGDPKSLLTMTELQLEPLRAAALRSVKHAFTAPPGVALCLFKDGSWVVQNFNDREVVAVLDGQSLSVAGRSLQAHWD